MISMIALTLVLYPINKDAGPFFVTKCARYVHGETVMNWLSFPDQVQNPVSMFLDQFENVCPIEDGTLYLSRQHPI